MAQGVAAPQRSECAGRKLVHSADLLADCFPIFAALRQWNRVLWTYTTGM
jgi:hypothetical protein